MINNILITGGAGFIGSNFLKYYLEHEYDMFDQVIILDKLTYAGDLNNIEKLLGDKCIFYRGDICDEKLVDDIIRDHNIKCIINFAAESHVDNSIVNQNSFIKSNVIGVSNLITIAKKNWYDEELECYMDNVKFIQISTDEVYGSSNKDDNIMFDEKSPLNPSNPYSATKASAEHIITAFKNTFNFPFIIIRSSNNYGCNQNEEKLIPKVIERVINNKDIPLYGDGLNIRNWINVLDNCSGIMKIVKNSKTGEIYNIAGNHTITNLELVESIISIVDKNRGYKYSGEIKYVKDRLGHDYCYRISGDKIKENLGFVPSTDFHYGITVIVNNMLNN